MHIYDENCGPGLLSRYSDSLRAGRSGDRIPVGARFSAPVQTGPGAHPASCTMGTGYFPGVKRPGRGVAHPPPSSAEVKERVELYLYSPIPGLRGLFLGELYLYLYLYDKNLFPTHLHTHYIREKLYFYFRYFYTFS